MKTFFKTMMLAAVSAMAFSGCSETFDDIVTGDAAVDMVELTISTEKPEMIDTRTMVDTDGKTPLWCVGDAIGVSVFAGGAYTNYEFMSDCTEPSKVTTFTGKTPVGDKIYTYYPYSVNGVDAQGATVVEIPAVQHPTATSFDGSADLLVGLPASMPVETTNIEGLRFKRVGGFLKIVLKEQDGSTLAGQIVEKVSVTADKALAGEASLDIVKGVLGEAAADGSKTVTADYTSATGFAVDGDGAAYLGVYPQTLAKGTKLTVSAVTTHYQVEREIDLPEDIEINAGRITTLNIKITSDNISEKIIDINEAFPDPIFRQYVSDRIDTNKDGKLSAEEALKVTSIDVSKNWATSDNEKIASLEGVQYFSNLQYLDCYNNQLTSLDLSNNTALISLACYNNQLTILDMSKNTALTYLNCDTNRLLTLNVSNNYALETLDCDRNQLTTLDVSQNVVLEVLQCYENHLTHLDLSNNTKLIELRCYSNPLELLNLGETNPSKYYYGNILYKDYPYFYGGLLGASGKLKVISSRITMLDVSRNNLQSLDISECSALTDLSCGRNKLTNLDVSHNTALTYLDCISNQLTSLDVSKKTELVHLECSYNNLIELNIRECTALTWMHCGDCHSLTSLDLSSNTVLADLNCCNNQLTSLDLSNSAALTDLRCYNNQLTSLDLSKNTALTTLDCYNNQLTSLDLSKNTALTTLDCDWNQLTSLDLSNSAALTKLRCCNNQLTSLDVHGLNSLISISAYGNNLKNVNITGCTALEGLDCNRNQLQSLDISTNIALIGLGLEDNQLTSLDASNNINLDNIDCPRNQLTSLILPQTSTFRELTCSSNQLTNLDVSGLPSLTFLWCYNNQLTSLDVSKTNLGNSTKDDPLKCYNNPLLDVLYLKKGWEINGITTNRSTSYIPAQTTILFIDDDGNIFDEDGNMVDGDGYGNEGEAGGELGDNENDVR